MKRFIFCLMIIFILIAFAGCKPEYVSANSIEEVYSKAINEIEGAKTPRQKILAWEKVKLKILKAQHWYLVNDRNNPRLKQLEDMYSLFDE